MKYHEAAALDIVHHNFVRKLETIKTMPAVAAGIAPRTNQSRPTRRPPPDLLYT